MFIHVIYILIASLSLLFLLLFYNNNKKLIHIRTNIYLIYDLFDRGFVTDKSYRVASSLNIIFNNCIYKFINSEYVTYTNENIFPLENSIENKCSYDNYIVMYKWKEHDQKTYSSIKNYMNLDIKTNNIDSLNEQKLHYINYNRHNIKIENLHDTIVDFIDRNYNLYNKFIQKINDIDNHIIKVCAYGPSGTGKTYFLKNIHKMLAIIKNNNIDTRNINFLPGSYGFSFGNNNMRHIFKHALSSQCGYVCLPKVLEIIINLDEVPNNYIDYMFELYNITHFNSYIILLCESEQYSKYYDNFDIKFEGTYLNKSDADKINENINKRINVDVASDDASVDASVDATNNITINDIVSFHFKNI